GIEGVVDGLLDAGEERLSRTVKPEEMPVLGEELGDRDLALARPHLDGGDRRSRRRDRRLRRRSGRAALHTLHRNKVRCTDSTFNVAQPPLEESALGVVREDRKST